MPASEARQKIETLPGVQIGSVSRKGVPTALVGELGMLGRSGKAVQALDLEPVVERVAPLLRLKKRDLAVAKLEVDELGHAHARYRQFKNGLEVVGASLSLHVDERGKVYAMFGNAADGLDLPATASLAESAGRRIALARHSEKKEAGGARLVYVVTSKYQDMHLAWEFRVVGNEKGAPVDERVFVDAITGEVVEVLTSIHDAISRKVYKYWDGVSWPPRYGHGAAAYPAQYPSWWPLMLYASDSGTYDPSQYWYSQNSPDMNGASGFKTWTILKETYNYFRNAHNRLSYDGNDSPLKATINYWLDRNNAAWDSTNKEFIFGFGDGVNFRPFGESNDVVTHEFAHGVTTSTSNLNYAYDSGGLNEAFSDFICAGEYVFRAGNIDPNKTWLQGDDIKIGGGAIRYMNDPAADGRSYDYYPDWAAAKPNVTYAEDLGHVHRTSGIANLACYLFATGGTHPRGKTTVNVPAPGVDALRAVRDATKVFYRAFTYYLGPNSQFIDARMATALAANYLNFEGMTATRANLAWDAVGVPAIGENNYPVNMSTRANVGTGDNIMIAGFVLGGGSTPKTMLLRGAGPRLGISPFNVPGAMADPKISLFAGSAFLEGNDDWSARPDYVTISQLTALCGAFHFPNPSKDAAMPRALASGTYTLHLSGVGGTSGQAMAEFYDTDPSNPNHLVNLSTRCRITASEPMIAGFVINGTAYKRLLIRVVGPGLAQYGVSGALADPRLEILSGSTVIYQNDNWNFNDPAIAAASTLTWAFPLTAGSKDAVLLLDLPAGTYTAQAKSANGSPGIGLV